MFTSLSSQSGETDTSLWIKYCNELNDVSQTDVKVVFFLTDLYSIILGQSGEYSAQNGNLRKKTCS